MSTRRAFVYSSLLIATLGTTWFLLRRGPSNEIEAVQPVGHGTAQRERDEPGELQIPAEKTIEESTALESVGSATHRREEAEAPDMRPVGAELSMPDHFFAASHYVADIHFNTQQHAVTDKELVELQALIDAGNERLSEIGKRAVTHLTSWAKTKASEGAYEEYRAGEALHHEDDCTVVFLSSHDGTKKRVRVYAGEFAPLDVAHNDLWTTKRQTTKAIRHFFTALEEED